MTLLWALLTLLRIGLMGQHGVCMIMNFARIIFSSLCFFCLCADKWGGWGKEKVCRETFTPSLDDFRLITHTLCMQINSLQNQYFLYFFYFVAPLHTRHHTRMGRDRRNVSVKFCFPPHPTNFLSQFWHTNQLIDGDDVSNGSFIMTSAYPFFSARLDDEN